MYSATKAAGEAMVRCWADAFGGREEAYSFMAGTTANAVLVGLTATSAMKRAKPDVVEKFMREHVEKQACPRVAEPEDVADVVGMLCNREARWITGSVVACNGGGVKVL